MEKLRTTLVIALIRLVGTLPLSRARALGAWLGRMAGRLNTRMVATTRINIQKCLPEYSTEEQAKLVSKSLQHTGMVAAEVCSLFTRPKPLDDYLVGTDGLEVATSFLAQGKGLVVLAPHLGNWEILGLYLPRLAAVTNLYQPPKLAGLDQMIRQSREHTGAQLVPTNAKGVSALLKGLRSGGICGILPDQNPNERASGEFAPFFGYPAFTMTLVHKLLVKTGARAVLAYAKRKGDGFELVFRKAPEGIYSEDTLTSLTALNEGVEQLVREAPEQYQWEYKRFKIQPPERNRFY